MSFLSDMFHLKPESDQYIMGDNVVFKSVQSSKFLYRFKSRNTHVTFVEKPQMKNNHDFQKQKH